MTPTPPQASLAQAWHAKSEHGHAWQGHTSWCVAQGDLNLPAFLATWHAWTLDPQRPTHLHVLALSHNAASVHAACRVARTTIAAYAPPIGLASAIATHSSSGQAFHALADLLQQVTDQCWGLLPGMHRLRFAHGHVTLTLCVGDSPEYAALMRQHPTGPCLPPADLGSETARTVTVIGSGISGAGTARALAERGWQVTVLDAGSTPAAGASGVPVGVIAPHTSHDDSTVSRLTRAGVRLMRHTLQTWLNEGNDWVSTGVLERRLPGKTRRGGVPLSWLNELAEVAQDWTHKAPHPAPDDAYWHAKGAWLRPAQLVRALLDHPNIRWQGHAKPDALKYVASHSNGTALGDETPFPATWQVLQAGTVLAEACRVVIAAGPGSAALVASATTDGSSPLINPVRGQISWGLMADLPHGTPLPASPVNGNGAFVHSVSTDEGPAWFVGSTFDRLNDQPDVLADDHQENHSRLAALLPDTAHVLAPLFGVPNTAQGEPTHAVANGLKTAPDAPYTVRGWAGIRCGTPDRFPVVGAVPHAPEGLWINAAMGSRGLTLALLCGEILAARWQGEPLPVEAKMAKAMDAARFTFKP
ncbi:FAD-dependent oxidoreductase [Limnohabitans sp. B9-3]|uniref:FAD-dependent oxidoreductase n=1 Tax=Limnohabitans sp. B9-3 TaxID=1100707 RepID=UPI001179A2BA|nr:FAD-dependent oxidoreductase [Limnohabitans sp. B9-3]